MLGSKAPNKAELAHMGRCKEGYCIVCLLRVAAGMLPPQWAVVGHEGSNALYYGLLQYHHCKVGNMRVDHYYGFSMCEWHHEGVPPQGFTHQMARDRWGHSLKEGSARFHQLYGTDAELIEIQRQLLTGELSP